MKKNNLYNQIDRICKKRGDPFNVRRSTAFVVRHAKHVSLIQDNILLLAKYLESRIQDRKLLTHTQFGKIDVSSQMVFLQDVVNFCFWAERGKERWSIEYPSGTVLNGWYALTACFVRAIQEGLSLLDCEYLRRLSVHDARHIFRSNNKTEIPLLDSRVLALREAGNALQRSFQGRFENLIKEASYDAVTIVRKILEHFPSFRDSEQFEGKEVTFLKRAQICAYDISLLPEMRIKNTNLLTVFADYKLPQLLRAFGVLVYSPQLSETVNNQVLLQKGSRDEVEIRSTTVWASELLAELMGISPALVDNALWLLGSELSTTLKPYHRTYTTYY